MRNSNRGIIEQYSRAEETRGRRNNDSAHTLSTIGGVSVVAAGEQGECRVGRRILSTRIAAQHSRETAVVPFTYDDGKFQITLLLMNISYGSAAVGVGKFATIRISQL